MSDVKLLPLTRRGFLSTAAATLSVLPQEPVLAAVPPPATPPDSAAYVNAATRAAQWIRSAAVRRQPGISWLPDPDHPDKATTVGPDNTLYSGSAGVVLFFLELAQAMADESYLNDASLGADYLASSWRQLPGRQAGSILRDQGLSFDQGLAGAAFALAESWKATQNDTHRKAALQATRDSPAGALQQVPA